MSVKEGSPGSEVTRFSRESCTQEVTFLSLAAVRVRRMILNGPCHLSHPGDYQTGRACTKFVKGASGLGGQGRASCG